MQLMVSRSYPVIDAQTLTEYVARDALFRTADGSYFLYMASGGQVEGEERILFLDCRDALLCSTRHPTRLDHTGISPRARNSVIHAIKARAYVIGLPLKWFKRKANAK
jgi:hypothetical protein